MKCSQRRSRTNLMLTKLTYDVYRPVESAQQEKLRMDGENMHTVKAK